MSLSTVQRCITLRRPLQASKLEPLLGPPPPPPLHSLDVYRFLVIWFVSLRTMKKQKEKAKYPKSSFLLLFYNQIDHPKTKIHFTVYSILFSTALSLSLSLSIYIYTHTLTYMYIYVITTTWHSLSVTFLLTYHISPIFSKTISLSLSLSRALFSSS